MYVAVKGGERAILNSYRCLDAYRRGDTTLPEITLEQNARLGGIVRQLAAQRQ